MDELRIFVSSPGDVAEERAFTCRVLGRLAGEFSRRTRLLPIFREHKPLLATSTFQHQTVSPSEADIVVCITWSRLGTRLPGQFRRADGSTYSSGTGACKSAAQSTFIGNAQARLIDENAPAFFTNSRSVTGAYNGFPSGI